MECHDLKDSRRTTGVINVGQITTSNFEICDVSDDGASPRDTDWFRVQLRYGETYVFQLTVPTGNYRVQPNIQIAGMYGIVEERLNRSGQYFVQFTARHTGTHYISAFQGDVLNGSEYSISSSRITDDETADGEPRMLWTGFTSYDELESVGDEDRFQVKLTGGHHYSLVMNGTDPSLAGATLILTNQTGQQLASNSSDGRRAAINYTPTENGTYFVTVSAPTQPGQYALNAFVIDEVPMGISTKSELTFGPQGQLASTEGFIGTPNDIDWHRIRLNRGDLVRLSLRGVGLDFLATPTLIFRGPNRQLLGNKFLRRPDPGNGPVEYYHEVLETGDYFVVARTNISTYIGAYQARVERSRAPISQNYLFGPGDNSRLFTLEGGSIKLDQLVDVYDLQPRWFEVYSTIELKRDGVTMEANRLYSIPGNELNKWELVDVADGLKNLAIRARVSDSWSQWQTFPVFGIPAIPSLDSGNHWAPDQPITFRFATELPSYYAAGEINDFSVLSSGLQQTVFRLVDSLSDLGINIVLEPPECGCETANINIFMGSGFASRTMSHLPGDGRGGDIILNTAFFGSGADVTPGSINYFNIVRGLAHALGLNFIGGDATHAETVMAPNPNGNQLFPSTFSPTDLWTLGSIYGRNDFDPALGTSVYRLAEGRAIETIPVQAQLIDVDPDLGLVNAFIDLRDNGHNYITGASVPTNEAYIGPGALVIDAVGGPGNDRLLGNGLENQLVGNQGNDFLVGYEMDDRLFGGAGNDIYIHYFGDGNDSIADSGGLDTLCFFGRDDWHIDQLEEDYEFTRIGRFLDVNLTLDGGESEGSVRIDMGLFSQDRVERLELWHGDSFTARISLVSIMEQLGEGQTGRFRISSGSDIFGDLVSPV